LISAGLFLVAHETLIDTVKQRPLSFFADCWTDQGPQPSARYFKEVRALDPKNKNDPMRGSIAWLRKMDIISEDDEKIIHRLNDVRNEVAHEMIKMIGGTKYPEFAEHFAPLMTLINKIEKWWIINVEISTDPDFDGNEIDEASIVTGPAWILHMLAEVALGDGDDAWALHREFNELWQSGAKS
jgi:hypothetical protein